MKATGVIRRIDDLGRIVIPKEIRRNMKIREGDSLEIFVKHENEVVLKKFSPVDAIGNFSKKYIDAINSVNNKEVIVFDREKVVATTSKYKKDYLNLNLSSKLDEYLEQRKSIIIDSREGFKIIEELVMQENLVISPINVYGDIVGGIAILSRDRITDVDKNISETASVFIGKYLEN